MVVFPTDATKGKSRGFILAGFGSAKEGRSEGYNEGVVNNTLGMLPGTNKANMPKGSSRVNAARNATVHIIPSGSAA